MKLYTTFDGIEELKEASRRKVQRERERQQTFKNMKGRKFPDRPLDNRIDWSKTPLFETLAVSEIRKTQLNLFPNTDEKGGNRE